MAAYAAGDRRAFEQLFAIMAPKVHGLFMRSFSDAAVADDLTQRTFLEVHRARGSYRPELPLRPWLFAIAAHVRLDELRRRYRLPRAAGEEALDGVEAPAADPPARLDEADRAARVRAALGRLPETQRVVVHLHRFEGMTFGAIAKALGTSEVAVRVRAFRAYGRLREELRDLAKEAT